MTSRSGIGVDVHPLVSGRPLVLGGVTIPFEKGVAGHSDGDVTIHAIIDALLGAAGLGDIGSHFPSSDPQYEGVSGAKLLGLTLDLLARHGWRPLHVDATILAERPALKPFMGRMRQAVATCLGLDLQSVNLKATTTDGLGFVGRGEGIGSLAIATVEELT
ncbi:MAG: 2-C-methyl-D-erythritol 2,4-cyclodiphosphate synthase [Chloroflexi bacterium]|nr:2-C-methyl-D-erythritol 2,4-cyclodiphosphate synthase [Chloroflexota bacterium]